MYRNAQEQGRPIGDGKEADMHESPCSRLEVTLRVCLGNGRNDGSLVVGKRSSPYLCKVAYSNALEELHVY